MLADQQVLGHRAVVGHLDLEAGGLEVGRQGVGQDGVVFGQQGAHVGSPWVQVLSAPLLLTITWLKPPST